MEETIRQFILTEMLNAGEGQDLKAHDSLLQSGIIDSVGLLRLVMFVEETFQVTVADEDLVPENFESIQAVTEYVRSKQALPAA